MTLDTLVTCLAALSGALIGGGVVVLAQHQQFRHDRRVACRGLWLEVRQNIVALDFALKSPATPYVRLSDRVFRTSLGRVAPLFHGHEPDTLLDAYSTAFAAAKYAVDAARSSPSKSWEVETEQRLRDARHRFELLREILLIRQPRAWRREEAQEMRKRGPEPIPPRPGITTVHAAEPMPAMPSAVERQQPSRNVKTSDGDH